MLPRVVVAVCAAALCLALSGTDATAQVSSLNWLGRNVAPGPVTRAKCIVIAGKKFCDGKKDQTGGTDHKNTDKKDTGTTQAPTKTEPQTNCTLGTKPDGQCVCPPGQVNYSDGTCAKPCGYGMSGKPPNCKCVTGATLQVTGPNTKGCLCPDGMPPEDVDGNYACQNLGPQ